MLWENLFMPYANNKGTDQPAYPHSLISLFVIHCLDCIIPILAIAKISRLASLCSWAGQFEFYLVGNTEDMFLKTWLTSFENHKPSWKWRLFFFILLFNKTFFFRFYKHNRLYKDSVPNIGRLLHEYLNKVSVAVWWSHKESAEPSNGKKFFLLL